MKHLRGGWGARVGGGASVGGVRGARSVANKPSPARSVGVGGGLGYMVPWTMRFLEMLEFRQRCGWGFGAFFFCQTRMFVGRHLELRGHDEVVSGRAILKSLSNLIYLTKR